MIRTKTCGELRKDDADTDVVLAGWVQNRRDHGGVMFIDLRDRYGLTQIKFDLDKPEVLDLGQHIRNEWVLKVSGKVLARPDDMVNPKMETGEIELDVVSFEVLSQSEVIPFDTDEYSNAGEEVRMRYRYIDMRRPQMQRNLRVRHKAINAIRRVMDSKDFLEIETPILGKSTPEGARDYLVPSRVHHGMYYALPQSPQIFKQILMVGGCDRYYQIARCFRDEDLRADRQPEFTQFDLEMSFAEPDDIFEIIEECMIEAFKDGIGVEVQPNFERMSYVDAIRDYGCDKPDLRFDMKLSEVTDLVANCGFGVFANVAKSGGMIKGLVAKGCQANYSRKDLDGLHDHIKDHGAKGLAWIKILEDGTFNGAPVKFFGEGELDLIAERMGAQKGDIMMFMADKPSVVNNSLAALRNKWGELEGLTDKEVFKFVWITEFPLFEWNEDHNRFESSHHPFTMIHPDDESKLYDDFSSKDSALGDIRSTSYDLVLNGVELASGSVRIHDSKIQNRIFEILGISTEEAEERFGFFVEALRFGTPPHAGIAPGVDRMVAMMLGYDNIREVIAFPKNQKAMDLMTGAPAGVDDKQLDDLAIKNVEIQ